MTIFFKSRSFVIRDDSSWHVYNYYFAPLHSHRKYGMFTPPVIEARPEFINYIKRVR